MDADEFRGIVKRIWANGREPRCNEDAALWFLAMVLYFRDTNGGAAEWSRITAHWGAPRWNNNHSDPWLQRGLDFLKEIDDLNFQQRKAADDSVERVLTAKAHAVPVFEALREILEARPLPLERGPWPPSDWKRAVTAFALEHAASPVRRVVDADSANHSEGPTDTLVRMLVAVESGRLTLLELRLVGPTRDDTMHCAAAAGIDSAKIADILGLPPGREPGPILDLIFRFAAPGGGGGLGAGGHLALVGAGPVVPGASWAYLGGIQLRLPEKITAIGDHAGATDAVVRVPGATKTCRYTRTGEGPWQRIGEPILRLRTLPNGSVMLHVDGAESALALLPGLGRSGMEFFRWSATDNAFMWCEAEELSVGQGVVVLGPSGARIEGLGDNDPGPFPVVQGLVPQRPTLVRCVDDGGLIEELVLPVGEVGHSTPRLRGEQVIGLYAAGRRAFRRVPRIELSAGVAVKLFRLAEAGEAPNSVPLARCGAFWFARGRESGAYELEWSNGQDAWRRLRFLVAGMDDGWEARHTQAGLELAGPSGPIQDAADFVAYAIPARWNVVAARFDLDVVRQSANAIVSVPRPLPRSIFTSAALIRVHGVPGHSVQVHLAGAGEDVVGLDADGLAEIAFDVWVERVGDRPVPEILVRWLAGDYGGHAQVPYEESIDVEQAPLPTPQEAADPAGTSWSEALDLLVANGATCAEIASALDAKGHVELWEGADFARNVVRTQRMLLRQLYHSAREGSAHEEQVLLWFRTVVEGLAGHLALLPYVDLTEVPDRHARGSGRNRAATIAGHTWEWLLFAGEDRVHGGEHVGRLPPLPETMQQVCDDIPRALHWLRSEPGKAERIVQLLRAGNCRSWAVTWSAPANKTQESDFAIRLADYARRTPKRELGLLP